MTSPLTTDEIEQEITNYHQALLATSAESDDSGLSDNEASKITQAEDLDYQDYLSSTHNSSSCTKTKASLLQQKEITLPSPPIRPPYFHCNPAWHWEDYDSPVNSDGEEKEYVEDSEEGAIPESSKRKVTESVKKGKSPANKKYKADQKAKHKKAKTEEALKKTLKVPVEEGVNLHALRRRSRGRQPPSFLERTPLQLQQSKHYWFTKNQVQNGLIFRDSKQRALVHLFPLSTIPQQLLETLAYCFQPYDNSVSFPNNNYSQKRGDYDVRIL